MPDIPAPQDFGPPPPWIPERDGTLKVPLWAEELVVRATVNLLDFAREWRPDVILRETNEYGGQFAAEVLGIPHAVVDIAPFAPLEIPRLDERKDEVRARFGVSATEPCFTAGLTPASWHPARHHFRVPTSRRSWERAPEIVASFGTNAGLLLSGSKLLHVVVEALGKAVAAALKSPELRDKMQAQGMIVGDEGAEGLRQRIARDTRVFAPMLADIKTAAARQP